MEFLTAIEVEVELVINHSRHLRNIVVKRLELPDLSFRVTPDSRIGGCAIEVLDIPPRASHPDGSPRYDLLNFRLRTKLDSYHFQRGQKVLVDRIFVVCDTFTTKTN
ncbi:hypothetical protein IQ276_023880 [Desmonostoc muscorum LEGE 12446]|uniref:Uncharacterized protein n=1 Tax=Desmonostoc muscorum LEGE 12446 TaxID=1828758 RepID=A0A8J7AGG5_DESMC|nr:hypothetical protein [Desmonostoc muscorum]MCF2149414.1 hypothetical protein [Desmonostoc muscorum LEGE 12446]